MHRFFLLLFTLGLILMIGSCSSDSDSEPPLSDAGSSDAKSDTGSSSDATQSAFSANTGEVCEPDTVPPHMCSDSQDECLLISASGKGMCQSICHQVGETCPAPNPRTMLSICANENLTGSNKVLFCAFVCKIKDALNPDNTVDYECPNKTDFDCIEAKDEQGASTGYWYCEPK